MGVLVPFKETGRVVSPELAEMMAYGPTLHTFTHQEEGRPKLLCILSVDEVSLEDAFRFWLNHRRWRHLSVSVVGQWKAALEDQQRIGRKRAGGERSPVPLPDWYDLTHLAYEHGVELGFTNLMPIFQYLPPPGAPYLNVAEALHLRQPA